MKKFLPIILGLSVVVTVAISANIMQGAVYYNSTDSLPHGFYRVKELAANAVIEKGDIAVFPVPNHVKELVEERRWLPPKGHLMKPVVGVAYEQFCTDNMRLVVASIDHGSIIDTDSRGYPLPVYQHCGPIENGHVVVAVSGLAISFDSRNYGPIPTQNIIGKATPLWTF